MMCHESPAGLAIYQNFRVSVFINSGKKTVLKPHSTPSLNRFSHGPTSMQAVFRVTHWKHADSVLSG